MKSASSANKLPPLPDSDHLKRSECLYRWYKDLIEHWELNIPIPSQNVVMRETGVSLSTVTTALKRLEEEGLVRRYHGKGTFISQRNITKYSGKKPARRAKKILIIYFDSSSEVLWSKIRYCEEFIARNGLGSIQFKLHPNSKLDDIIKMIRNEPSIVGVVVATAVNSILPPLKQMNKLNVPISIMEPVDLNIPLENLYITHPDYFQSGYTMAQHLISSGHRKIGYIRDVIEPAVSRLHQRGIEAAFRDAEIPMEELKLLVEPHRLGEFVGDAACRFTKMLLSEHPKVTAIIYDTAVGAHGGILAIHQMGKSVPGDVSVIGEGDYSYMHLSLPPITVTSYDHRTRAQNAIQSILGRDKNLALTPIVLIERESVHKITPLSGRRPKKSPGTLHQP